METRTIVKFKSFGEFFKLESLIDEVNLFISSEGITTYNEFQVIFDPTDKVYSAVISYYDTEKVK